MDRSINIGKGNDDCTRHHASSSLSTMAWVVVARDDAATCGWAVEVDRVSKKCVDVPDCRNFHIWILRSPCSIPRPQKRRNLVVIYNIHCNVYSIPMNRCDN